MDDEVDEPRSQGDAFVPRLSALPSFAVNHSLAPAVSGRAADTNTANMTITRL